MIGALTFWYSATLGFAMYSILVVMIDGQMTFLFEGRPDGYGLFNQIIDRGGSRWLVSVH